MHVIFKHFFARDPVYRTSSLGKEEKTGKAQQRQGCGRGAKDVLHRDSSLIRNRYPPLDPPKTLVTVLLQDPRGMRFHMSEAPLLGAVAGADWSGTRTSSYTK